MTTYFITGIDTGVGKSYVTGLLAKQFLDKGKKVITAKLIQTGNNNTISEDILTHRKMMGIPLTEEDKKSITCPYIFKFPSSPHLAARLEKKVISLNRIDKCLAKLQKNYDIVLIEGVGGLCVPIKTNFTTLDYLIQKKYPTYVVTTPKLGSINHTILTIDTLLLHKIPIAGIIYNVFSIYDKNIARDTEKFLKNKYKKILKFQDY